MFPFFKNLKINTDSKRNPSPKWLEKPDAFAAYCRFVPNPAAICRILPILPLFAGFVLLLFYFRFTLVSLLDKLTAGRYAKNRVKVKRE
ncbi:hypothetical protein [Flavobacterium silvaticum]|uniref:Uncharacterized protein n=1 Tax=Flavobacterium silvaticum TaxID=1852020 RepID=A0A972FNM6_9FLAO|nr:hypothetical protein [Flavobacterium silvaticum]NMH26569.1 hypothetical protein [Flavobacterium silvaticum]